MKKRAVSKVLPESVESNDPILEFDAIIEWGWTVIHKDGKLQYNSFAPTRKKAIDEYMYGYKDNGDFRTWKQCVAKGDKCVRSMIVVSEK